MTSPKRRYLSCFLIALASSVLFSPTIPAQAPTAKKSADAKKLDERVKEIAGTAEFLRSVPKHFATLKASDSTLNQVTLLIEGEVLPKVWNLTADAEVKVFGWWGRLGDLKAGDRVWVWFKTDRQKRPAAVAMIADEVSEQDLHGSGVTVQSIAPASAETGKAKRPASLTVKSATDEVRTLSLPVPLSHIKPGSKFYVQSANKVARLVLSPEEFEKQRDKQKAILRERWAKEGLPGSIAFVHVFSGEMDLMLDHETMRWARSLRPGDKVTLRADPPIKALVKSVAPWRERTEVRLVVHSQDLADLAAGQRLHLLRTPPAEAVDADLLPPDVDLPRTRAERVDWFMASIYCTCGVSGDRCTGHFYTLASCNPNGCGMPNAMRKTLAAKIDQGLSDRQIFQELLKNSGPELVRPHLLP
jgi:hypothetical protein